MSYFLSHKLAGVSQQFYTGILHDFDVFGQHEPWQIWQIFQGFIFKDSVSGHGDLYFFTKLKKSNPNGKSTYRKVGSGTDVHSDSHPGKKVVTGSKKRFHYENGDRGGEQEDGVSRIMFEYSISPASTHSGDDYVLCQIRKKYKKYPSPSINLDGHQTENKKRKLCTDDHLGFHHLELQNQCQYQQPFADDYIHHHVEEEQEQQHFWTTVMMNSRF